MFVNQHSSVLFNQFGVSFHQDVIVGEGKMLFYMGNNSLKDYLGDVSLSAEELNRVKVKFSDAAGYLTERKIKFLYVVAPDKQTVYPEFMPDKYKKGEKHRIDQVLAVIKDTGTPVLDLTPILQLAKNLSKESLYYRNDTHWNAHGAFYGFNAIQQALGGEVVPADAVYINKIGTRESDISGNFLNLKGLKEDEFIFEYFRADAGVRKPCTDRKMYNAKERNGSDMEYSNPNGNGKSLLLFRDSFSESLLPYFTSIYSRVRAVWSYEIDIRIIEEFKPDYVVFENVERYSNVLCR